MPGAGESGRRAGRWNGIEPVTHRLASGLVLRDGMDKDKQDNDGAAGGLGSPVSPLPSRANTTTTSSSSSSGSATAPPSQPAASGSSETSPAAGIDGHRVQKIGHRRSGSGSVSGSFIFSGRNAAVSGGGSSSSASSPLTNVLPAGNICPSGKITGMVPRTTARSDVLGSGTGNYGHGSIMRGGTSAGACSGVPSARRTTARVDPQEVTRAGNEHYNKGNYAEALWFYDKAAAMCPDNAACRSNRAAALTGLGRLREAVAECEAAASLDPASSRAHHRLASLYLRLGQIENARRHISSVGNQPDLVELKRLQDVERHLSKCAEARKMGDWKSALREADAAIAAGADASHWINASKAEALLKLHQIDEADSVLSNSARLDGSPSYTEAIMFLGMQPDSYVHIVRAQVDMALGRFESAVEEAEKAKRIDSRNTQVTMILNNVKSVARARSEGNEMFKLGNFAEACTAYGEGLKCDPSNAVLLCNRAACRSKLGQWEKSLEDCNRALTVQPNYAKALLRRADSNAKLERWAECVRDYQMLSKEIPGDTEVAEALFHAQVALKTSRGEEVSDMKFGGEVEEVASLEQFQAAIRLPGASVIYFTAASNKQCSQISPFVDSLCTRYPSANFLKVDVSERAAVAKAENVRVVPTFKIYRRGTKVKEMICPSQQMLESSVRHYAQ